MTFKYDCLFIQRVSDHHVVTVFAYLPNYLFIFLFPCRGHNQNLQFRPVHMYKWKLHSRVNGL